MVFARLAVVLALKLNRSVTLWAQRERQRELDTLLRVKSALEKRPPIPVPGRAQEIVGLPGLHRELRERRLYDVSQRFYRQHDIWGERAQGGRNQQVSVVRGRELEAVVERFVDVRPPHCFIGVPSEVRRLIIGLDRANRVRSIVRVRRHPQAALR